MGKANDMLASLVVRQFYSRTCADRCRILESCYFEKKHLWYRPDMVDLKRIMKASYTRLLQGHQDHLTDPDRQLIQRFLDECG